MAVQVPFALAVHEVAAVFNDHVGAVVVRLRVDQRVHVGHQRGPVQQLEKEGIVVEDVEEARALLALGLGESGLRRASADEFTAARDSPVDGGGEAGDVIGRQEILEDEVALVVEGEFLGGRGDGGFDRGGAGSGFSHGGEGKLRDVAGNCRGQKADSGCGAN